MQKKGIPPAVSLTTIGHGGPQISTCPEEAAAAFCCLSCEHRPASRAGCRHGALPPLTLAAALFSVLLQSLCKHVDVQFPNSPHFAFLFLIEPPQATALPPRKGSFRPFASHRYPHKSLLENPVFQFPEVFAPFQQR